MENWPDWLNLYYDRLLMEGWPNATMQADLEIWATDSYGEKALFIVGLTIFD